MKLWHWLSLGGAAGAAYYLFKPSSSDAAAPSAAITTGPDLGTVAQSAAAVDYVKTTLPSIAVDRLFKNKLFVAKLVKGGVGVLQMEGGPLLMVAPDVVTLSAEVKKRAKTDLYLTFDRAKFKNGLFVGKPIVILPAA